MEGRRADDNKARLSDDDVERALTTLVDVRMPEWDVLSVKMLIPYAKIADTVALGLVCTFARPKWHPGYDEAFKVKAMRIRARLRKEGSPIRDIVTMLVFDGAYTEVALRKGTVKENPEYSGTAYTRVLRYVSAYWQDATCIYVSRATEQPLTSRIERNCSISVMKKGEDGDEIIDTSKSAFDFLCDASLNALDTMGKIMEEAQSKERDGGK